MAQLIPDDNGFITMQFADEKFNFEGIVKLKIVGSSEQLTLTFWVAHEFIGIN